MIKIKFLIPTLFLLSTFLLSQPIIAQKAKYETYNSKAYTFQYPATYSIVTEPTEAFPALMIKGGESRVEIFKNNDSGNFHLVGPNGERMHGYSSSGADEHESKLVPKEKLVTGTYTIWLFYRQDDSRAKKECRNIFKSFQAK
jgi:hypothetical protein